MSRITIDLTAGFGQGKTMLMTFLIQNLIRVGAFDPEMPLGDTHRLGKQKNDHFKGQSTETYELEIDLEKVVEAINFETKGLRLTAGMDTLAFNPMTLETVLAALLDNVDHESLTRVDNLTLSINRIVP